MSPKHVSKTEFKVTVLEYFRQVEASGESVIVTNHGKPALEVRPCRGGDRHPLDKSWGQFSHSNILFEGYN